MLELEITLSEDFDEETNEFLPEETFTLQLEHSLISLSKWESEYKKPFLTDQEKTLDDTLSYLRHMVVGEVVPEKVFDLLTDQHVNQINEYMSDTHTATWISDPLGPQKQSKKQIVTSELIYSWMIALSVPFECQHWHLNRLFTLLRVCGVQNAKETQRVNKDDRRQMLERRKALNEERKRKYKTSG